MRLCTGHIPVWQWIMSFKRELYLDTYQPAYPGYRAYHEDFVFDFTSTRNSLREIVCGMQVKLVSIKDALPFS